ncbi:MAG: phage minor capsid protein [Pseudodesulfovibrio sp.]|uniref:phage minor capsid protein n=1 Tax=Pseudodesulfovibrio sp. TaxID=2035812 RepID=UPI003D145746
MATTQEAPWQKAVDTGVRRVLSAFDAGEGRVLALLSAHRKDRSRWSKSSIDVTMKRVGKVLSDLEIGIIAGLELGAEMAAKSVGGSVQDLSADIQRVKSQVARMAAEIRERITSEARQVIQAARVQKIAKSAAAEMLTGTHLTYGVQTTFGDRSGKKWKSRTYFEVLADASTMNSGISSFRDKMADVGNDIVQVAGPADGCPKCQPWIGRVLSLTGVTDHPTLDEAMGSGLFHPRCRHHLVHYQPEKDKKEK